MKVNEVFLSISLNTLKWWRIINHTNAVKSKPMMYIVPELTDWGDSCHPDSFSQCCLIEVSHVTISSPPKPQLSQQIKISLLIFSLFS